MERESNGGGREAVKRFIRKPEKSPEEAYWSP
jgi:hypothetical protein